jgi:arginyl-tRNA synthetase
MFLKDIVSILENDIKTAIYQISQKNLDNISLQKTRDEFNGDFTFLLFQYFSSNEFVEMGNKLGLWLKENSTVVDDFEIVKGFLNLSVKSEILLQCFNESSNDNFGHQKKNGKKLLIEYSSPNTNKPLHLGHLRNNFLGFAMSSIFDAAGYDVTQVCLVNDRGIHICKSMVAYKSQGNGTTPESENIKGDHFVGNYYVLFDKIYREQIAELKAQGFDEEYAKKNAPVILEAQDLLEKWERGDAETLALWEKMNKWVYNGFNETYKKINIHFDKIYYESKTYLLGVDIVLDGLKKGIFYLKDDNSIWVDLTDVGLDNKLLLRGNGTSVYITQDLGTADLRYEEMHPDKMIYVVGDEQNYHFNVLKAITHKLDKPYSEKIYHLSYGMVDLPSGKMKSREGTVVDADDLIDEMREKAKEKTLELGKSFDDKFYDMIGLGALKFFLLKVNSQKRMMFDPNKSINFQGDTASFIQYNFVRIQSLLRKNDNIDKSIDTGLSLENIERKVIFEILEYPDKILDAAESCDPSIIAQYVLSLTRDFSKMYEQVSILKEEDIKKKNLRLVICQMCGFVIKDAMKILGIDVPDQM